MDPWNNHRLPTKKPSAAGDFFFFFSTAKRMATSVQGAVEREVFKGDWYEASA